MPSTDVKNPRATEATLKSLLGLSARDAAEVASAIMRVPELPFEEPLDMVAELLGAQGCHVDREIARVPAPAGVWTLYFVIAEGRYYIGRF